jgi:hypothetical protein
VVPDPQDAFLLFLGSLGIGEGPLRGLLPSSWKLADIRNKVLVVVYTSNERFKTKSKSKILQKQKREKS